MRGVPNSGTPPSRAGGDGANHRASVSRKATPTRRTRQGGPDPSLRSDHHDLVDVDDEARIVGARLRGRLVDDLDPGHFGHPLLAAILRAIQHGSRVVISTHTIALQEQLIHKDIPFLQKVLPAHLGELPRRRPFAGPALPPAAVLPREVLRRWPQAAAMS